jgi:hypothetical protein
LGLVSIALIRNKQLPIRFNPLTKGVIMYNMPTSNAIAL